MTREEETLYWLLLNEHDQLRSIINYAKDKDLVKTCFTSSFLLHSKDEERLMVLTNFPLTLYSQHKAEHSRIVEIGETIDVHNYDLEELIKLLEDIIIRHFENYDRILFDHIDMLQLQD